MRVKKVETVLFARTHRLSEYMTWQWRNAEVHHQTDELLLGPAHGLTLDRRIFGLYYPSLAWNPTSETQLQSL